MQHQASAGEFVYHERAETKARQYSKQTQQTEEQQWAHILEQEQDGLEYARAIAVGIQLGMAAFRARAIIDFLLGERITVGKSKHSHIALDLEPS